LDQALFSKRVIQTKSATHKRHNNRTDHAAWPN
jgi:hypothetical protein